MLAQTVFVALVAALAAATPIPLPNAAASGKCGVSSITEQPCSTRIVGGCKAPQKAWPWMGVLQQKYSGSFSLICGATYIGNGWAMSAGHCVEGQLHPANYRFRFGTSDEAVSNGPNEVQVIPTELHQHPKYDPQTVEYDITLFKLPHALNYTDYIRPICLPANDGHIIESDHVAWVTGWGTEEEGGGSIPKQIREVQVPFLDQSVCDKEYGREIFNPTMFCAGRAGKDSCQGDSGGPLVYQNPDTKQWFEHGIVSWGQGCAEKGHAGVYSRVSAYCAWIAQTTGGDVKCQ